MNARVPPINDLTPCVVKCSALGGYTAVVYYREAKKIAMEYAAGGFYAEVLRADVMVTCYGDPNK